MTVGRLFKRLIWGVLEWPIGLLWASYAWLVRVTSRVTVIGTPPSGAAVYVNWHRFQPFLIPHHGSHSRWMLVSPAPPLAPVARFCRLVGLNLVRGTSGDRGKQALEELVQVVRSGQSITIAVDGPAGPRFEVKRGCVDVASRTGAPIVPVAYSCRRGGTIEWRWDKSLMPAPFDHITIRYGTPILIDASSTDDLERVKNALNELSVA